MNIQLAQVLIKLCNNGAIAGSDLSDSNRNLLKSLFHADVLSEERSGRGYSIIVKNREALSSFIDKYFPQGLAIIAAGTMTRSQGVARLRNSKRGVLDSEPVFVIAKPQKVLSRNSESLPIGELTATAGIATFLLEEKAEKYWAFTGAIALIENYEIFVNWLQTDIPADIALWTAGRISSRMINWLGSSIMRDCAYVHCGDYDPVGIDEFVRLNQRLENRVTFYIPNNIDLLFRMYSNQDLLKKTNSAKILQRLRQDRHPEVLQIINLIDQYGGALEQEVLLCSREQYNFKVSQ